MEPEVKFSPSVSPPATRRRRHSSDTPLHGVRKAARKEAAVRLAEQAKEEVQDRLADTFDRVAAEISKQAIPVLDERVSYRVKEENLTDNEEEFDELGQDNPDFKVKDLVKDEPGNAAANAGDAPASPSGDGTGISAADVKSEGRDGAGHGSRTSADSDGIRTTGTDGERPSISSGKGRGFSSADAGGGSGAGDGVSDRSATDRFFQ